MNLSEILAHIGRNPLQKDSHFKVSLGIPRIMQGEAYDGSFLGLSCDSVIIPGLSIEGEPIQKQGYGRAVNRPKGFSLANRSLTFYVDEQGQIQKYFDTWAKRIVGDTNEGVRFEQPYYDDFVAPMTIQAFSVSGAPTWSVEVENCYPADIGDLEMNWAGGDVVMRLAIGISYSNYDKQEGQSNTIDERNINPIQSTGRGQGIETRALNTFRTNQIIRT